MPYQCLKKCGNILIAARGSSIDSFSLEDHSLLSTWKCPSSHDPELTQTSSEITIKLTAQNSEVPVDVVRDPSSPPAKRRKLSAARDLQEPSEKNGTEKKKVNNRSDAVASGLQAPAIIALAVTTSGKHVIAVTGEDKSIRVFENVFEPDGKHQLRYVSQR
jgi:tRNA (guanine-N(7)-)-methyltransferase subunit TRM82